MSERRKILTSGKRWVVKIGSALMTGNGAGLEADTVKVWAEQIVELRKRGIDIVIVSSGAVAAGMATLRLSERPTALNELQATAAVGQMGLVQIWDSCFQPHAINTAQVLLTHEDIVDRRRYLNARSTLRRLIDLSVIPIINENDTVSTEEIRFGDNDNLAGLVANLIEADLMILMTDQDGLFKADPRHDPDAELVEEAKAGDPSLLPFAGRGGALGRGGMLTKLKAAETAAKSGADTLIVNGNTPDCLLRIQAGKAPGTLLYSDQAPLAARKQWLAGHTNITSYLVLDEGAVKVLISEGKSLLAVGVHLVEGDFNRGEVISCRDIQGKEIARGLVNYDADSTRQIIGQPSQNFQQILGYVDEPELIHRDNLILV